MGRSTKQASRPTSLKVGKILWHTRRLNGVGAVNCGLFFPRDGRVLPTGQRPLPAALPEHAGQLQMRL